MKTINFDEIYNEHKNSIFRVCFMYLKDYHLAEDVTQETFYKFYCKQKTFKNQSDIKTWITRICINLCKDKMKKKSFREKPVDYILSSSDLENFSIVENKLVVTSAIMNLPIELREVVILFYYQQLKRNEIAKIIKQPETTVDYRLRKAKEILKITLKGDFYYE